MMNLASFALPTLLFFFILAATYLRKVCHNILICKVYSKGPWRGKRYLAIMLQKVVEILGKCNAAINCQNVVKPVVRYINTTLHLEQWNGGTVKQCQRHRLKLTKNSSSIDFEQHKPVLIPMQSIFRSEYE